MAFDDELRKQLLGETAEGELAPSQVPGFLGPQVRYFTFYIDKEGRFSEFDEAVEEILGYTPEHCCRHFSQNLISFGDEHSIAALCAQMLSDQSRRPFEIDVLAADGTTRHLVFTPLPQKKVTSRTLVMAFDMSHLHRKLSGYRRKAMLLDETEQIARMGTWDWNMETDEVHWSPTFYAIVQMVPEQVEPCVQQYIERLNEEDGESLRQSIVRCIRTHEVFEHFHRLFLPDGGVKYIEGRGKALLNQRGQPIRIIGTIHDVTMEIEAQGQLEKAYRLINSSVNEIYIVDKETYRFIFASEGACRNLGYSQKEITRLTPFDLCPMLPRVQAMELMAPVLEHAEEQVTFEVCHRRKDGSTYPVEIRLQLMEKGGPPMFVAVGVDLSSQKADQRKIRDQAVLLRSVIDASRDMIFFKDRQGYYLGCNKAFEQLLDKGEQDVVGQTDYALFDKEKADKYRRHDAEVFRQGNAVSHQEWMTSRDGSKLLFEIIKTPYYNELAEIEGVVGVGSDVTHHWHYEKMLQSQSTFLQSIIDNIDESVMVMGLDGQLQLLNKTARRFIEQGILSEPFDRQNQLDVMAEVFEFKAHKTVVHQHQTPEGQTRHIELMVSPLLDEQQQVVAAIEIGRDITAHLNLQQQLQAQKSAFEYSAHYDSLTQLPNRVLFHDRLSQSLVKARRKSEGLALFFLDLDRFKQINDCHGHEVGDKVLQAAAERIRNCVREMDSVARLGGDEFTVILESVVRPQSAALIAHKINQAMQPPIVVADKQLYVTASIGIALYPENGATPQELINSADTAMYRVKQESRDAFEFYSENMTGRAFERAVMENHLRNALTKDEMRVFYQPQYDLDSGRIVGIEALSRWYSPQLGNIDPNRFIPLAEDVGLIQAIDEWVLETACLQMVQWKRQGLGPIRLAVNLSPAQLVRKDLFDIVCRILDRTGCKPCWLELEVIEECFVGNHEQARSLMNRFHSLGIALAMDDFGTGYTSLSNLRRLPIAKLKIDRSFINHVPADNDDSAVARAVIGLAKSLGMTVIAEGVETELQQTFLKELHCDQAQGFLYDRPVSAEQMSEKLELL